MHPSAEAGTVFPPSRKTLDQLNCDPVSDEVVLDARLYILVKILTWKSVPEGSFAPKAVSIVDRQSSSSFLTATSSGVSLTNCDIFATASEVLTQSPDDGNTSAAFWT